MFLNLRNSIKKRATDVSLIKNLKNEISVSTAAVNYYIQGLLELVASNKGKPSNQFQFRPGFKFPTLSIFNQNGERIFCLFEAFTFANLGTFNRIYEIFNAYKNQLEFYNQQFMGTFSIQYSKDPHLGYLERAESLGLNQITELSNLVLQDLDRMLNGNKFWALMKKKPFYWTVSILLGFFLIFIPPKEAY